MRVMMFEPTGGFWPYTDDISDYIARRGVELTLLTSQLRATEATNVERAYKMAAVARPMDRKLGLRDAGPFSSLLWGADRMASAAQWLMARSRLVRRTHPDIVHIQSTVPILDQYVLPRFAYRYKVVMTVHDVFPVSSTRSVGSKAALERVYRAPKHLIVHSEGQKAELTSSFGLDPDTVSVIPHGVRPLDTVPDKAAARAALGLPAGAEILLVFGGLRRGKGLDVSIRALAEAAARRPRLRLVVAGSPPRDAAMADYESLAAELHVSDLIDWRLRFIPEHEVPLYFRAVDAVLLPYTVFHSQSGVLLQAYRCGVPAIVSDVGALGETVRSDKTGIVVPAADSSALADGICTLLSNGSYRADCSARMLSKVSGEYNWKNVAIATVSLYRRILTESGRSQPF